jgi:cholesterol transport system auxiliary component
MIRSLLLLLSVTLTSCSILPERVPSDLYQLPPSTLSASANAAVMHGLRIARPGSSNALDGSRVLVMVQDNTFQAYPNARWTAPAPALWRDWVLDAFWRDGRVSGLSSSSEGLEARYELGGMLRALHSEHVDGQTRALVRFDAQLIDTQNRRIIASRRFEAEQSVPGSTVADVVRALGIAADRLAPQLIEWTLEQGAKP